MTSSSAPGADRPRRARRAHLVWGAAVGAYAVAVLHRSSFGVAGVAAIERFEVGAAVLSTFVVVQLAVYAAMQVPAGVLLDRFGSRAMITTGAVLMATGQVLLALADTLAPAYAARVLIGAGDAATFISVVRLVTVWFPARQVPVFTQLTGIVGQVGQLASAIPLVVALETVGWTRAFVGLGTIGLLAAVLAWGTIREAPASGTHRAGGEGVIAPLRSVVRNPGTWLGFWTHSITGFPLTVFLLLWGYPFLTVGQGLSPGRAGALMSLTVLATVVSGPVIGVLTGRHPLRRSWMVLTIAVATAGLWAAVLLQPGPSPLWLLVALVLVIGVGGPGSAIGFDYARTFNPPVRLGTATGMVNVGGFATGVVTILGIGLVMDAVGGDAALSLPAFRVGLAVMAIPWVIGIVGLLASRRATRRLMAESGVQVPPLRVVLARGRPRRRPGRRAGGASADGDSGR